MVPLAGRRCKMSLNDRSLAAVNNLVPSIHSELPICIVTVCSRLQAQYITTQDPVQKCKEIRFSQFLYTNLLRATW